MCIITTNLFIEKFINFCFETSVAISHKDRGYEAGLIPQYSVLTLECDIYWLTLQRENLEKKDKTFYRFKNLNNVALQMVLLS